MLQFQRRGLIPVVLSVGCVLAMTQRGFASEVEVKDANQGVIQAIKKLEGFDVFKDTVEIESHKKADGSVLVTFRRPISQKMIAPGRLATRVLFTVLFKEGKTAVQRYDQNKIYRVDKATHATPADQKRVQIAVKSLAYLWGKQEMHSIEFALTINPFDKNFLVSVMHIPYVPDSGSFLEVSLDLKNIRRIR